MTTPDPIAIVLMVGVMTFGLILLLQIIQFIIEDFKRQFNMKGD